MRGAMANGGNGNGSEFELSQDVLAVLPSDPYEQLDVARRITAMAVAARVSKLEQETGKLRQKLTEKEHMIYGLQERVVEAESTLQETSARLSHALDEQTKLANEKNTMAAQVKKLMRDVAKLETFKRTLMQSLQEDDDNPNGEGGDKRGANSSLAIRRASQAESTVSRAQLQDEDGQLTKSSSTDPSGTTEERGYRGGAGTASKPPTSYHNSAHNSARGTPHLSPRLTPSGSPKGSGRASPRRSMSLTESHHRISLPSSQSTTAPNSPPSQGSAPARTPRVDGKDFFRQARNRLQYEQFSAFLANIKELNAHRQTREETLKKAEETFGPDNKDLYLAFEGLLSRHLPS
ncbi:hypothetical protein M758_5G107300 [Ceratodon purpureus]|uniref:At4g15545-like C-terminal domain-containing protein n=1 Tax=Ceratodon purpureus TaxID=3225 RepID=A0A8T0I2E1_CERPU|nr:hypothetical protein KC19_5G122200 [Ceratodon purpureus]KAG0616346.1 hypothetical protein M758_5G107300 [Ceratodon purpureus]